VGSDAASHTPGYHLAFSIASIALLALSAWPLLIVQQAINFNNSRLPKQKIKRTAPEILLIIVGVILFVAYVVTLFVSLKHLENKVYPQEHRIALQQQQQKLESLTAQYNTCAAELKTRAKSIDQNDPDAVDKYNSDLANCDAVREAQNKAVDRYDALIARKPN
jgi:cell division protein FtsB